MQWWDYAITSVSVLCTIFSICSAFKSRDYYTKSKNITIYANTNIAYIESQKIIMTLTEMLRISNPSKNTLGTAAFVNIVSKKGDTIKASILKIRESLPVDDCFEINKILNSQQTKVELYIDSFITGAILVNEKLVLGDDFNICQQAFSEIHLLIKSKLETISEKLK